MTPEGRRYCAGLLTLQAKPSKSAVKNALGSNNNEEVSNTDHPGTQLLSDHDTRDELFFCLIQVL
jgi:hypothetical protein